MLGENDIYSELIGSASYESTTPRLTGHTDLDGNIISLGDYYRIDKAADGTTTRTKVGRDEAVDHDFSGMGDIDRALKRWEFEKETSGEVADHLLSQARKYGLGEGLSDDRFIPNTSRADVDRDMRRLGNCVTAEVCRHAT